MFAPSRRLPIALLVLLAVAASSGITHAESRSIPLSSIISTSPQQELLSTHGILAQEDVDTDARVASRFLRQVLQGHKAGTSNLFLIQAAIPRYAMTATSKVLLNGHDVSQVVVGDATASVDAKHWLVAYLGQGSNDFVSWSIESAKINEHEIVLSVASNSASTAVGTRPYYYWVPLGTLEPGHYQLKLVDATTNETTLMRRVALDVATH